MTTLITERIYGNPEEARGNNDCRCAIDQTQMFQESGRLLNCNLRIFNDWVRKMTRVTEGRIIIVVIF